MGMMKDTRGKEFMVGDLIAYPQRSGSSVWLVVSRILELGDEKLKVMREGHDRPSTVHCYNRAVIIERSW